MDGARRRYEADLFELRAERPFGLRSLQSADPETHRFAGIFQISQNGPRTYRRCMSGDLCATVGETDTFAGIRTSACAADRTDHEGLFSRSKHSLIFRARFAVGSTPSDRRG
ncbi:hypothetical protein ATO1_24945 [Phaeobacter sp. 22II1-1F12B]|nr:hypothetical protein ATO1_24945 [Phaeobacter sp. 22II1-1F12B]